VIVVTGRMFRSVRPYLEAAGLDDPVVCYQGAVVADPVSGKFLRHEPIPIELAREAIAAVEAEGYPLNCYVGDELFVAKHTAASEAYASFQHLDVHAVGPLLDWLQEPPTKLVAVGDPVELDGLEARLVAHFGGRMYIARSLPYFLEFASPNVTKGSGLGFVAEHLGFSQERTVGFGDGENDVPLLEWAGYAVAVANAHERVLARADFVCPPVNEEGVAQVIEAYLALDSVA
jgi:Cof subfamily protein (haloacid dehalogenase superfamily)